MGKVKKTKIVKKANIIKKPKIVKKEKIVKTTKTEKKTREYVSVENVEEKASILLEEMNKLG